MLLTYKFDLKNFPVFTAKILSITFYADGKTAQIKNINSLMKK